LDDLARHGARSLEAAAFAALESESPRTDLDEDARGRPIRRHRDRNILRRLDPQQDFLDAIRGRAEAALIDPDADPGDPPVCLIQDRYRLLRTCRGRSDKQADDPR
jgi:hypothetical protein